MRHRRGVDDGIARSDLIDVGEIIEQRRHQVAQGQGHALGPPRGAAGIEQPGGIAGGARRDGDSRRRAESGVAGSIGVDHLLQRAAGQPGQRRVKFAAGEAQPRAAVGEDEFEFLGVQLGVDRHHHQTRVPAGEHQFEVSRAVLHHQRDPVVGLQPRRQAAGESGHARAQLGVVRQQARAAGQRRELRMEARGTRQQVGEVDAHAVECSKFAPRPVATRLPLYVAPARRA